MLISINNIRNHKTAFISIAALIVIAIVITIFVMLSTPSSFSNKVVYSSDLNPTGSKGYYYQSEHSTNMGLRMAYMFFDYTSEKSVFLCNRPDCKHDDPKICDAYFPQPIEQLAEYCGSLYAFADNGYNSTILYKEGLDGSNRSVLMKIDADVGSSMLFINGKLYYEHSIAKLDEQGQPSGVNIISINAVDLKNKSDTVVMPFELKNCNSVFIMGAYQNKLYYMYSDLKSTYDAKILMSLSGNEFSEYMESVLGDHGIFELDLETGKSKKILPIFLETQVFYNDSIFYEQTDKSTNISTIYRYSLDTGKTEMIASDKNLLDILKCFDGKLFYGVGVFNGSKVPWESQKEEICYDLKNKKSSSVPFKLDENSFITIYKETPDLFIVNISKNVVNGVSNDVSNGYIKKADYYSGKTNFKMLT